MKYLFYLQFQFLSSLLKGQLVHWVFLRFKHFLPRLLAIFSDIYLHNNGKRRTNGGGKKPFASRFFFIS